MTVSPGRVDLYTLEGDSITREVEIRAQLDKPLALEPVNFHLLEKVTYKVEEIERGRRFKVRFTSIPGPAGTFRGSLRLKTNYAEKPFVEIKIRGRIGKKG